MNRFLCGVVVWGLLGGLTGPANVPSAFRTYASRINESGQIVGGFGRDRYHGFLLDVNGMYATLDPSGATYGGLFQ